MRGDAVRDLALRAVEDNDAWAVLEDLLEQEPQHRLLVAKLIFRKWPRRWDLAMRCWIWRPGPFVQMAAVLKAKYSVASLSRVLYADSPLLRLIPKTPPFRALPAPPPLPAPTGNRHERRAIMAGRRRG